MARSDYKKDYFDADKKFQNLNIKFKHLASGEVVEFLPFVTGFEDSYEQIWQPTEVFGRMDAIKNFKRTKRNITLSWDVPSANLSEAIENYTKCQAFLRMNYPVFQGTTTGVQSAKLDENLGNQIKNLTTTNKGQELANKVRNLPGMFTPNGNLKPVSIMSAPPILGLKYGNFINPSDGGDYLWGTIQGSSFKPDLDMGFWTIEDGGTAKDGDEKIGSLIPKVLSFSISFEVIHTTQLGYKYGSDKQFRAANYPTRKVEDETKKQGSGQ